MSKEADKQREIHAAELAGNRAGMIQVTGHVDDRTWLELEQKRSELARFYTELALAEAYREPLSLDFGNGPVQTTLGDVRDAASELYNERYEERRRRALEGASAEELARLARRAEQARELMELTDRVARGEASPEELQRFLDRDPELKAALGTKVEEKNPNRSADAELDQQEHNSAGAHTGLSAEEQDMAAMLDDFEPSDDEPAPQSQNDPAAQSVPTVPVRPPGP